MELTFFDWAGAVVLAFALLLVLRLRPVMQRHGREAFTCIVMGIILLAVAAVGHAYNQANMFSTVPFVSDPLFYDLVSWIVVMSGIALLLYGISVWLPAVRRAHVHDRKSSAQQDIIRKTEQLVSVESRLDVVLKSTLESMVAIYGFAGGIVMKCAGRKGDLYLAGATGEAAISHGSMYRLGFSQIGWQRYLDGAPTASAGIISGLNQISKDRYTLIPVHRQDLPLGFFVLWKPAELVFSHEDEVSLKMAAEIVSRKIEFDRLRLHRKALLEEARRRDRLHTALVKCPGIEASTRIIADEVFSVTAADMVALLIADERRADWRRILVNRHGAVLVERQLSAPPLFGTINRVRATGQPLVMTDLRESGTVEPEEFFSRHNVSSVIAVPERTRDTFVCLLICSEEVGALSSTDLKRLNPVIDKLAVVALDQDKEHQADTHERQLERLQAFAAHISAFDDTNAIFRHAARLIRDETGADAVRISTVEDDGRFLHSRALDAGEGFNFSVPEDGYLISSVLGLHQDVLRTQGMAVGRASSGTEEVSVAEAEQVFTAGIRAITVIPVTIRSTVRALVSIGCTDGRTIGGCAAGGTFAKAVTEVLAIAMHPERTAQDFTSPAVMDSIPYLISPERAVGSENRLDRSVVSPGRRKLSPDMILG